MSWQLFYFFHRFDRLTMDQLTARKLLQRPRVAGSGAATPSNGGSTAPARANNLSPWHSPSLSQRQLVKNNHLNSSVQYLTSSSGGASPRASPNLERRSVNEGSLTGAKFNLTDDTGSDGGGLFSHGRNGGNGEMTRKRPIKNPRRPRSLSGDRRNSEDYEHVALLSPSEIRIRLPDAESESFKMETAIV